MRAIVVALAPLAALAASPAPAASSCGDIKAAYKSAQCCGAPTKASHFQVVPMPDTTIMKGKTNPCDGKKPEHSGLTAEPDNYFSNVDCKTEDKINALEQSGTNVTKGYKGSFKTDFKPITTPYYQAGLCPVNVHWHLGTEHLSVGQYDENGKGGQHGSRRLAEGVRQGFRCHHYDAKDTKFTTPYDWKHCDGMFVGETYEVHWPHSKAGMCGTPWQYQSPFYEGVFCKDGIVTLDPVNVNEAVGVQGQIFTIVNDEKYYYPDLMRGMIVDGDMGTDMSYYTGSTTGTTRSNTVCSKYTPITWQVDRKCHLISASSFDKMCADMKAQPGDMTSDLHAHGARELVADEFAANNHQRRERL
jgi:hypothetical protein